MNNMTEHLITFETAKLAKEKGFDECVSDWWDERNGNFYEESADIYDYTWTDTNAYRNKISRPTQSLLQKWLREQHQINISIFSGYQSGFIYEAWIMLKGGEEITVDLPIVVEHKYGTTSHANSYEEALEGALQKALTLIK